MQGSCCQDIGICAWTSQRWRQLLQLQCRPSSWLHAKVGMWGCRGPARVLNPACRNTCTSEACCAGVTCHISNAVCMPKQELWGDPAVFKMPSASLCPCKPCLPVMSSSTQPSSALQQAHQPGADQHRQHQPRQAARAAETGDGGAAPLSSQASPRCFASWLGY